MAGILSFLAGIVGFVASNLSIVPKGAQGVVAAIAAIFGVLGIRSAQPSSVITDLLNKVGTGWKTAVGVLAAAVGYLADPAVLGGLPSGFAKVVQVLGVILTAVGLYHAQAQKK